MEQEVLQMMQQENQQLEQQLTKKNQQYIFDLKKRLESSQLSSEAITERLYELLPQIIEAQKKGVPARQLLGTVSELAEHIIYKPKPPKQNKVWEMWLDNSLLILALLAAFSGIVPLFTKQTVIYGLASLFIAAMSGGYVFYLLYKYINQYDRPGADTSKKPSLSKALGIMITIFIGWFIIMSAATLIPPAFNPKLAPGVYLFIAAAALILRTILSKKYGIRGTLLMR